MTSSDFPTGIAIAGVFEHPSRFSPDKSEFQIMAECAKGALDDAGLTREDVDGLFGASMTMGMMFWGLNRDALGTSGNES